MTLFIGILSYEILGFFITIWWMGAYNTGGWKFRLFKQHLFLGGYKDILFWLLMSQTSPVIVFFLLITSPFHWYFVERPAKQAERERVFKRR